MIVTFGESRWMAKNDATQRKRERANTFTFSAPLFWDALSASSSAGKFGVEWDRVCRARFFVDPSGLSSCPWSWPWSCPWPWHLASLTSGSDGTSNLTGWVLPLSFLLMLGMRLRVPNFSLSFSLSFFFFSFSSYGNFSVCGSLNDISRKTILTHYGLFEKFANFCCIILSQPFTMSGKFRHVNKVFQKTFQVDICICFPP